MSARFRQYVEDYRDQAWTLARYVLKDPAEAEDAVQEAFVKLWHHHERVDPDKIKPWLMTVTRNACLDRIRRRKPEVEADEQQLAGDQGGPAHGAENAELGRWLRQAIAGLREPYRSLIVLRDIQQHSYDEVATALELSLTQVKVYLHRARKQLREQLAEVAP